MRFCLKFGSTRLYMSSQGGFLFRKAYIITINCLGNYTVIEITKSFPLVSSLFWALALVRISFQTLNHSAVFAEYHIVNITKTVWRGLHAAIIILAVLRGAKHTLLQFFFEPRGRGEEHKVFCMFFSSCRRVAADVSRAKLPVVVIRYQKIPHYPRLAFALF